MAKYDKTTALLRMADQNARIDPSDFWRCGFHLTPPAGWLNDPNGLCRFQGYYHVFFQYAPAYPQNSQKAWGHYRSPDLINWEYLGIPLYPDTDLDKDGAYSGSALVENDRMYLFYTGNVKEPGEHDFTHSGRLSNTILVESRDGIHFSEKRCVLDSYPSDYTCHIRDPKVSGNDGRYDMVLGGRRREDKGAVLRYTSKDKENWELAEEITTEKPFGYMWECPDLIQIGERHYLAVCPQGLEAEEYRFQNNHQAGYFLLTRERTAENFVEWDMGFDFYAPQIFMDEKGRHIMIGWIGLPDEPYGNRDEKNGWTQALSLPRVLTQTAEGLLRQYPAEELEQLREKKVLQNPIRYDWIVTKEKKQTVTLRLSKELELKINEQKVLLQFTGDSGAGRTARKALHAGIEEIRILADGSVLEIYFNHGEMVMTTRIYQETPGFEVGIEGKVSSSFLYEMKKMSWTDLR
ncbi:MAG: glycoside hydrolase family 32 protein [Lachnospiraceae bacterium]|nr:glycoside hydrolase family 32 protein [Lachnospiraceae bacterium]